MSDDWNPQLLAKLQQDYRDLRVHAETIRSIQTKYRWLDAALNEGSSVERSRWQTIVSAYPGALREAEMCSPDTLRSRCSTALALDSWLGRSRTELLADAGAGTLILWHDLHQLLKDLQTWRSLETSKHQDVDAFLAWAAEQSTAGDRIRWPASQQPLRMNQKQRPDQRTAYAWLGLLTDICEQTLLTRLLDRVGARRRTPLSSA